MHTSSLCLALASWALWSAAATAEPVEYIRPTGSRAPFSTAVRVGETLYVSGQIGMAPNRTIAPDFEGQSRQAMENLKSALQSAGASLDDVVKCNVMLADMKRWEDFNKIYVGYFKPEHLPARSAFGVTALANDSALEIDCVAHAPGPAARAKLAPTLDLTQPIVSAHTGTFNGKRISYDAIVEPFVVSDASGTPAARLVGISYVRKAASETAQRPVLFVFNGGPISPSATLHMGALGPKRVAIPADLHADPAGFKTVDNPYTVLDVADVVFFDPASTGYSRVLESADPKSYFSVAADAQQLAQFVVEWSKRHGRTGSPKYLFGESYGTIRAAAAAQQLQKLQTPMPLSGVVLMGQALNIIEFSQRPANVTSYIVSLPTLASIAWSHGKANAHGQSFDAFIEDVQRFARTDYLTALFQGSRLEESQRTAIAQRLQDYTGVSAAFYLANALKITKERYRRELFADQKLLLGETDARYAGPAGSVDPASVIPAAYSKGFDRYLHGDLKVPEVGEYLEKSPVTGLEGWGWNGGTSPFSDWPYMTMLRDVFEANKDFRLMVANGWQDTQTTVGAAQLAVDQSGWPRDRVSTHFYQGGHMAYSVEDSLRQLTQDVRQFISSP